MQRHCHLGGDCQRLTIGGNFMKKILLPLLGLLAAFVFGCSKQPEGPAEPLDFVEGVSGNNLDYTVSGQGTSTNMELHIHNKSEQHWEVHVKVGTKLEPADESVQKMVVTEEMEVEIHPHAESDVSIPVACLDISKDPPGQDNADWTIKDSTALAEFIPAAKSKIDELAQNNPDKFDAQLQASILQGLLWKGRGATEQDMIDCMVKYHKDQGISEDEARQIEDKLYPILEEMDANLPSITDE